jgi:hypothetical protein
MNPSEIIAEIGSKPPLMREDAARAFVGKDIDWTLIYRNAYETSSGRVRLMLGEESDSMNFITGAVLLGSYPELKSLPANEKVRVRGIITSIESHQIEISIQGLQLSMAAAAH